MPNQTHTLTIHGMTCQACATRLEKVLNKKDSVERAEVNFATETLTLSTESDIPDDEILTWIKKTGFTGDFIDDSSQIPISSNDKLPYRLIALGVLSLPFWVGMVGMMTGLHVLMPPNWEALPNLPLPCLFIKERGRG